MQLHHIGVACEDIAKSLEHIKKAYDVKSVSDVIFDEQQNASLCLILTNNGATIELISGPTVNGLIEKGISYYHLCFTVKDIVTEINRLKTGGMILVSPPKPAILFENKLVAFLYAQTGLIELLEE